MRREAKGILAPVGKVVSVVQHMSKDKGKGKNVLVDHVKEELVEGGQKKRLYEDLKQSLIESGWRDELKEHCKEAMRARAKASSAELTLESLTKEVTRYAQGSVPDSVKTDFLEKLKVAILKEDQ